MIDILVKDNYFDDPDSVRKLALSYTNYRIANDLGGFGYGWRGQRTLPIRKLKDQHCPCCNQLIENYSPEDNLVSGYAKNIFDLCNDHFDFVRMCEEELTITAFFHVSTEETRGAFPNFWQDRFHSDPSSLISGIVYLTPDAPLDAGTTIMDAKNNQLINVENKYNRLVAYDGSRIHALSDVFGTCRETGRMTLTFFIHTVGDTKFFT